MHVAADASSPAFHFDPLLLHAQRHLTKESEAIMRIVGACFLWLDDTKCSGHLRV